MVTAKHTTRCALSRTAPVLLLSWVIWMNYPAIAQPTPTPASDETRIIAQDEPEQTAATISARSTNQSPRQTRRLQQQRLLADLPGPPAAIWLESGGEEFLGFWQSDLSGEPLGAVLMLHAEGQNPRWRGTLLRLHQSLPHHGWATLSVELPALPEPAIPARTLPATTPTPATQLPGLPDAPNTPAAPVEVDETQVVHQDQVTSQGEEATRSAEPTRTEAASVADVKLKITQRIAAATRYLNQQGQYNLVLLGEGAGAHWALAHLKDAVMPEVPSSGDDKNKAVMDRPIRALILVDIKTPAPLPEPPWTEQLKHPQVPTLDLYTDYGLTARKVATKRRQDSVAAGYETYVQKRLPPQTGADPTAQETALTKAIRGFLQKHARGVELDQAVDRVR